MSGGDDGQQMSGPVYEMFWDCEYCGASKLLGVTHRHCPQCGAAQDPEKRYFPPEDEKVAVQDHEYFGADWECGACETPNSNASGFCGNCGAPKDGAGSVGLAHEREEPEPEAAPPEPPKSSGGRGMLGLGCVGLAIVGFILFCLVSTLWTRSDSATVTGHRWERTVQIQEYQAVSESDWCDDMPSGAYSVNRSEKQRDTTQVPDGEECETVNVDNGDGTFHQEQKCETVYREEAVYDTWCSYKVDKWDDLRVAEADGDGLSPVWPQVQLRECGQPSLGCQREGTRSETYTLQVQDSSGESHTCDVDEAAWRGVQDQQQIEITVRVIGGGVSCDL